MPLSLDYHRMIQDSLRSVVREVLTLVERDGLPSPHHFYLTFDTGHEGVEISHDLAAANPDEVTIVLEHQFWDLRVGAEAFSVDLSFGGVRQCVRVPFAALTAFADPAAEIGLRFTDPKQDEAIEVAADAPEGASSDAGEDAVTPKGRVVPFERSRRD